MKHENESPAALDGLWKKFNANVSGARPTEAERVLFLTNAVRTATDVNLHEGYTLDSCDDDDCTAINMTIAVTCERLLSTFETLIGNMGKAVIPRIYAVNVADHVTEADIAVYEGERMDPIVLQSHTSFFTDVLLHDGRSMLEIDHAHSNLSVQISPEKLLIVHAGEKVLKRFRREVENLEIRHRQDMDNILGHRYSLITTPALEKRREGLIQTLGMGTLDESAFS
jgi:hypothetical protein